MRLIQFWLNHGSEFSGAILRHLALVAASTGIAVALGVPLGVVAYRNPKLSGPLIGLANIAQTIPSLAMFGFLIPLPFIGGIGPKAALIVLILYALLPVMQTTVSGLKGIDPSVREAGVAMGMTERHLLWMVELPLALNSIIAGVRVAAVVGVGTATIAAAVGAGGLGQYIFQGVDSLDNVVILAGAIPAAALALLADFGLGALERRLSPGRQQLGRSATVTVALIGAAILLFSIVGLLVAERPRGRVSVGSKNFAEQAILGEMIAQTIERSTSLKVQRKLQLGDTLVCEKAMQSGDLDVYVEYTGTALTSIFKQPIRMNVDEVRLIVEACYSVTGRTMMPPLGFSNTFAVLVRGNVARELGLKTISDTISHTPRWRAGFGPAFLQREDGYRGLTQAYGLSFADPPLSMQLSLTYRALAEGSVDMIAGNSTDGLIDKLGLLMLEDDRHYFPPYQAVPVVRAEALNQHPELRAVFERLAGKVSEKEMRQMNYEADVERRDVSLIARAFLERHPEVIGK